MILRCLLSILVVTGAISRAVFEEINCVFMEVADRGIQCELLNVHASESTNFEIANANISVDAVVFHTSYLHTVPSKIFFLFPELKYLDVDKTQLKTIKPDNFHNANQLKYFFARSNELTRLESETFSSCLQIKFIVLEYNKINYIHPRAFLGLNNLEALVLDNNRLITLPEKIFDHVPNLLHFSMAYNNITSIPDDLFMNIEKLESFNLGHNLLTYFNDEQFHELPHLERVQLDHNKLSELDLTACKSAEIHIDNNDLREIQLNKWTKIVTAWGNPVRKLVLHEHYGTGRSYNFSFNDVTEIVFYVHEHCCTVENLENFYILTLSFGDLSKKQFDVNDWDCKFRKNIGYETDKGYVTNNVCVRNQEPKTETTKSIVITSTPVTTSRLMVDENKEEPSQQNFSTLNKSVFSPAFDIETSKIDTNEQTAIFEESATPSYENKTEKSIWKSVKSKVGGWKSTVVNKWNTWVG